MDRLILRLVVILALSKGGGPANAGERTLPTGDGYSVRAIAFAPDGKLLLTGHGTRTPSLFARGHVKVWDVKSGKELARVKVRNGPPEAIAFAPDGKTFAAAARSVKVWDVQSRKLLREFSRKHRTLDLEYALDGKVLATCPAGDDFKGARIRDPATGKPLAELRGHKGTVVSVSFSADGKTLATSSHDDERVILWDTATWKPHKVLRIGVEGCRLLYSPTDSLLFVSGSSDQSPALWDVKKGKKVLVLTSSYSIDAAFSPDGKSLATVDTNGLLTIWDVKSGARRAVINSQSEPNRITAVAFSPDGKLLASGDRKDRKATMVRIFEVGELLKKRTN